MANDNLKEAARDYYIEMGKTAKEIAAILGRNEKTIGKWVREGNWKDLRTAKELDDRKLKSSIKELMATLIERRISLYEGIDNKDVDKRKDILSEINSIGDEIAKLNKTLSDLNKNDEIPLHVHLKVMEKLFAALRLKDDKLHFKLLDFQSEYLQQLADEYR